MQKSADNQHVLVATYEGEHNHHQPSLVEPQSTVIRKTAVAADGFGAAGASEKKDGGRNQRKFSNPS